MKFFAPSLSLVVAAALSTFSASAGVTITGSQFAVTTPAGGNVPSQFSGASSLSGGVLTGTQSGMLTYQANPLGETGVPAVRSELRISLLVDGTGTWIADPTFSWNHLHMQSSDNESPAFSYTSSVDAVASLRRFADANANQAYDPGEALLDGSIGFTYVTSALTDGDSAIVSGALPANPATAYGNAINEELLGPGETWVLFLTVDLNTDIPPASSVTVNVDTSSGQGFAPFTWTFSIEEAQVPETSTWAAAAGLLGLTLAGWIRRR